MFFGIFKKNNDNVLDEFRTLDYKKLHKELFEYKKKIEEMSYDNEIRAYELKELDNIMISLRNIERVKSGHFVPIDLKPTKRKERK